MIAIISLSKRIHSKMSLREKLLCLLFLLTAALIWGQSWMHRASEWKDARQAAKVELATQQQLLDRSENSAERLVEALERVDPQKTYSGAQLSGRIDALLRVAALSNQADIDPVRSREGEIFNDHNLRVRLSRISIAQLIKINTLLKAETPYINIQKVQLTASSRTPEQLDARFEINSFDLKDRTPQE